MLTERQLLILQVIIDDFIRSAHPVGSRTLAKKEEIALSSATIRNEMADLEELGFIEKTHVSSGRVPSEKGYRFYVDHLIQPQKLHNSELERIQSVFAERYYEFEKIVQNSAKVLSDLTKYTAIVLGPAVKVNKLNRVQIIPLNERTALAVLVTDTGHIENRVFAIPQDLNRADFEKVVNILNSRLAGVPLNVLQDKLFKEVSAILREHVDNYEYLLRSISEVFHLSEDEKLYYSGKNNMLAQPEFQDLNQIKNIFDLIEKEQDFSKILKKTPIGLHVKIGSENNNEAMNSCSLITATYNIGEEQIGTIAILGPKRMNYSRVISLLNLLSKNLTNELTRLYFWR
ncbi:heat-inducible transcriptional repressor HrcA [Bacillus kwashiorkori]|uniref:heat-inducible transcriptional repressor HrcA n=1 Tax=Bacillus kwashiorkori TaxID=1522318 RepID=UPI000785B96E|nr:heat-inducible transcriptional repressor HrcA [Bacillus kwashiorkori]